MRLLINTVVLFRSFYSKPIERSCCTLVRFAYAWVLVSLCLTFAGCSNLRVKQPISDSTPPSLVWNVFNYATQQQTDFPGSTTINAKLGERYRVILKANDPEGVKFILINPAYGDGEIGWRCNHYSGGENVAQNKTLTLGSKSQNLAPDANGMVLTSIFLIFELNFELDCQAGWSFASGRAQLTGQAGNYFGGVSTEIIKFAIAP